jgi:transposase
MRYELTDDEWTAIKPMLPNKPRGVPRVNDRRVLNGIFWVLRSGAPWARSAQQLRVRQARGYYLAFVQLASIRLWLRVNEATP